VSVGRERNARGVRDFQVGLRPDTAQKQIGGERLGVETPTSEELGVERDKATGERTERENNKIPVSHGEGPFSLSSRSKA